MRDVENRLISRALFAAVLVVRVLAPSRAEAQAAYEHEPINYLTAPVNDPVAKLQKRLDARNARLDADPRNGYLASLLRQLNVPVSSQTLVFSKTSFQRDRIGPANPRAMYFDDNTYVGWVPGGDVIELASTDPHLGTVFYTLEQPGAGDEDAPPQSAPRLVRQTHGCLQCHGSTMTRDVPGLLLRSVYPDGTGQPVLSAGTFMTTQQSPWPERWGGWYVTGDHGRQRHMGNVTVKNEAAGAASGGAPAPLAPAALLDVEAGANVSDLSRKFDASDYLSPRSDIVALMVFAHQAQMHNLLTRANYLTRLALRDEAAMNESLGRPAREHSQTTLNRIKDAGEPVVRYMLFADEAPLGKVQGSGDFDRDFESRGPRDRAGRSLRELDLKRRLFKYPCSYLIYSEQFDALPQPVKDYVCRRLWDVLNGAGSDDDPDGGDFSHLSGNTGQAVIQILRQTKPGLPAYWSPGR